MKEILLKFTGAADPFAGSKKRPKLISGLSFLDIGEVLSIKPLDKAGKVIDFEIEVPLSNIPALIQSLQQYAEHAPAPTPVPEPEHSEVDGSNTEIVLELGKKYLTRNGQIAHVEWRTTTGRGFGGYVQGGLQNASWLPNGRYWGLNTDCPHDLIAEYKEETP